MSSIRLSRRAMIRGAGSIAIALPWLEIMETPKAVAQAASAAKRYLQVYTPGGCQQLPINGSQRYWPSGTETAPVLSPILGPLLPVASKLLTIRGLEMKCANSGEAPPHQTGSVGLFSGATWDGGATFSRLASIDQVIAGRISTGKKKKSLQLGIRWGTGQFNGAVSTGNTMSFEDGPGTAPIPPSIDPVAIYSDLFGTLTPSVTPTMGQPDPSIARKKSILDFTDKKFVSLGAKLGPSDKAKLDQHLEKIREIEKSLDVMVTASATCHAPTKVDTSKYDPTAGLYAEMDNAALDNGTDGMIPTVGKYMTDMMVMALACDITAVGHLQWSDSECQHSLPYLNLLQHHHYYQHENGYAPAEIEQIGMWYSQQHLYLLQQMMSVDMGGHSLLDESLVFFGSEIGWPESHSQDNIPIMLAGGAGIRTGRHLDFRKNKANDSDPGIPHNNLLVSILNLFGDARTSYQEPGKSLCNDPISLT
ncbi:MAG: DUF1552 domain-containing protein [Polyangiaceae bacterium]|nr:DUF1552 domain-containing protein [Polyangiaceae bacterium]